MNKETWLFAYSIARAAENLTKLRYPLERKESVDFAKKVVKENKIVSKYELFKDNPYVFTGSERINLLMTEKGYIFYNNQWFKREDFDFSLFFTKDKKCTF